MKENNELLFETAYYEVILLPDQLYLGRSVVFLKRSCGDLAELNQAEVSDFFELLRKLQGGFKKTFGATMFNWSCMMNFAYQKSPPKPQVHWHFRPRYEHPVEFDGHVFKDPNFGHHPFNGENDDKMLVSKEVLRVISLRFHGNPA